MQIQSVRQNTPNFKGLDARRAGLLVNSDNYGILKELQAIRQNEQFSLFLLRNDEYMGAYVVSNPSHIIDHTHDCWAQDLFSFVRGKLFSSSDSDITEALQSYFKVPASEFQSNLRKKVGLPEVLNKYDETFVKKQVKEREKLNDEISHILNKTHIKGGNFFVIKGKDGDDELLIGADELNRFKIEDIKKMFEIEKVHVIPQMDYHLDLFIRPLRDGKVLLADDNLMVGAFETGIKKLISAVKNTEDKREKVWLEDVLKAIRERLANYKNALAENKYSSTDEVAEKLTESGFEVVRVPGRIFEAKTEDESTKLIPVHNYMNAHALLNDKDEIVYITNQSDIDKQLGITPDIAEKTGFSVRQKFLDAISPYVKKEHVYFISAGGEIPAVLRRTKGGIHCMCAEVPA